MGEETDDVLNTAKLQSKIKALTGVDIVDATGAFRSTYDILVDIGRVYDDLDSMTQSSVLELLAGKTRSNALGAILSQIDTVEEAYESAMNAEGSALAENEKYLDSIQGKTDQFTNAMQTMWSNALDSDWVKGFVQFGTTLIQIVDKIGLVHSALIALMAVQFFKTGSLLAPIKAIPELITAANTGLKSLAAHFGLVGGAATTTGASMSGLTVKMLQNTLTQQGVIAQNQKAILSEMGLANAKKKHIITQNELTKETLETLVSKKLLTEQQAAEIASMYGLNTASKATVASTNAITVGMLQEQLATAGVTAENQKAILSKVGLDAANKNQIISSQLVTINALKEAVANKSLSAVQAFNIAQKMGLITVTKSLNGATTLRIAKLAGLSNAETISLGKTLGVIGATKTLTKEEIKNAIAKAGITDAAKAETLQNLLLLASQGKLSASLKLLGMQIKDFIAKNSLALIVMATVLAITALVKIVDACVETMEEAEDKFNELNSALEETESKLDDLNSQLKETKERIDELNSRASLSFVDQEELDKLREQSAELQRQIDLSELLRKQQQKEVNDQALHNIDKYEDVGINSGKTTGENVGTAAKWAGGIGITATGITAVLATLGVINSWNPVGWVALAAATITGIAVGVTAAVSSSEEKIGDSMDNMKEQYDKLQSELAEAREEYSKDASKNNKKKYEEAQEAFDDYQSMMAENLDELNAYYQSIDLSVYDDPEERERIRKEMQDFYDTQDKWAIQSGGANAKSNATTRILGESDDLKNFKKEMLAAMEDIDDVADLANIDAASMFPSEQAFNEFKTRIHGLGLTITDFKYSIYDLKKAEEEALEPDVYGTVKEVANLEDSINSLKSAMEEMYEGGIVPASTITELAELTEGVEDIDDEWEHFVKTVASGNSTFEQTTKATEELLEKMILSKLSTGKLELEEYVALVGQLKTLGVSNAAGLVDAMTITSAVSGIANEVVNAKPEIRSGKSGIQGHEATEKGTEIALMFNPVLPDGTILTSEELDEYAEGVISGAHGDYKGLVIPMDWAEEWGDGFWGEDAYNQAQNWLENNPIHIYSDSTDISGLITKYEEMYGIQLTAEQESLLIQKAIAVEKAKQKLEDANSAQAEYDNAQYDYQLYTEDLKKYNDNIAILKASDDRINDWTLAFEKWGRNVPAGTIVKEGFVEAYQEAYDAWKSGILENPVEAPVNPDIDKKALEGELESAEESLEKALDEMGLTVNLEFITSEKLVDDFQEIYDTLASAEKEYNENATNNNGAGYVTVDTLQSLLSLSPKYLNMLYNEQGQLELNKDTLLNVAKARTLDMGIQAAQNAIDQVSQALKANNIEKLKELTKVTYGQAESGWALVEANLAVLKTQLEIANTDPKNKDMYGKLDGVYESVEGQVFAIQDLTNSAIDNIANSFSSAGNTATDAVSSALDNIMSEFERKLKLIENQITYIENEISILEAKDEPVSKGYYKQQIDLEEKKIKLYKDERDALLKLEQTDEVAEQLWEVEHAIQESTLRVVELTQSIIDLYKAAFDDMEKAYGDKGDLFSDQIDYIDKYMDLMELEGGTRTKGGILAQIGIEEKNLEDNKNALNDLVAIRDAALASGELKEGSEEWIEMESKIRAQEAAILDSKIALAEYNEELKQLHVDAFELVRDAFSNKDSFFTSQQDYIQGYADLLGEMGIDVPDEVYEKLIDIEKDKRENNVANLVDARAGLADLEAQGYTAADEEWQDAYKQITDLEKAVQDNDIAIAQWNKTIRDADFEKFERFIGRLEDIDSELQHLYDILSKEDVANEEGEWTEEGITSLGILYQQMELAQQESEEYAKKIEELNDTYAEGEMSEQEYYERLQELKEGQWDSIDAYENAKDAMIDLEEARIDMIEEGINKEIEAYSELIQLKKDELDAERDYVL